MLIPIALVVAATAGSALFIPWSWSILGGIVVLVAGYFYIWYKLTLG